MKAFVHVDPIPPEWEERGAVGNRELPRACHQHLRVTTLTPSGGMSAPHRPGGSSQVDPVQAAIASGGSGNESRGARARAQPQWTRHMLLPWKNPAMHADAQVVTARTPERPQLTTLRLHHGGPIHQDHARGARERGTCGVPPEFTTALNQAADGTPDRLASTSLDVVSIGQEQVSTASRLIRRPRMAATSSRPSHSIRRAGVSTVSSERGREVGSDGEHASPAVSVGRSGRKEWENRSRLGVFALGRSLRATLPLNPVVTRAVGFRAWRRPLVRDSRELIVPRPESSHPDSCPSTPCPACPCSPAATASATAGWHRSTSSPDASRRSSSNAAPNSSAPLSNTQLASRTGR